MLITEASQDNCRAFGARKIWRELNQQGHQGARCIIERLTREPDIACAMRRKKVITTMPAPAAAQAPDLVDRDF